MPASTPSRSAAPDSVTAVRVRSTTLGGGETPAAGVDGCCAYRS